MIMMKRLLWTLILLLLLPLALPAEDGKPLDMNEYLYGHVGDSYEWHITTVNGHEVSIPLPVIVISKQGRGAHCFSSRHLHHGNEYAGFRIADEGKYSGKIVERASDGSLVRPWDFSVTKNVAGLLINSLVLLVIVLGCSSWYRKHDACEEAPRGAVGLFEMLVTMVENDIIKDCVATTTSVIRLIC